MSILFRALALLFAIYVFLNFFGKNKEMIETTSSDITERIELIRMANDSITRSSNREIMKLNSQLVNQKEIIDNLEGRITEIELLKEGPKQSSK